MAFQGEEQHNAKHLLPVVDLGHAAPKGVEASLAQELSVEDRGCIMSSRLRSSEAVRFRNRRPKHGVIRTCTTSSAEKSAWLMLSPCAQPGFDPLPTGLLDQARIAPLIRNRKRSISHSGSISMAANHHF